MPFAGFATAFGMSLDRKREGPLPHGMTEEKQPFLHEEIVSGVPARRVKNLIDSGALGAKQVFRVIPERTFKRRLASRQPLKANEADAIARYLRITQAATDTFGDAAFARRFLNEANPALGGRVPFELAETDAGAREVEAVLNRIAHGVYS